MSIKKGINEKNKLITDDTIAETGKISVGTFIDFKTPALATTDVSTWLTVVLKKFQKINPLRAYNG